MSLLLYFLHMQTIQNIIKYTISIGLFIIPFIAFIVPDNMFFPFITGKGFTFRILVEILFGLYVALAFIDKSYRPKFSWITKSILVFVGIIFIADLLGENPNKSIWSNYERMEGFVLLAHLALYYIVLSSFLKTKSIWNSFINTNIVASLIMVCYGLVQLSGGLQINQGGVRVDGTFGNASYLAMYMVFGIFLSLFMFFTEAKEKWQKWFYGITAGLQTVILYHTATRGAILGFIGGLALFGLILLWKERDNKKVRKFAYGIFAGLFVVVALFVAIKDTDYVKKHQVLSRFSTLSPSEIRTQGRYYVWPMAIEGFKERPLLGWGQENFNFVFNKYYDPNLFGQEEWFDRTHNLILDWLIAGGILGLLSYLSIYWAFFYYLWRKNGGFSVYEKGILTAVIVAYVFHNLFVFDNLISYILFFTILAYVHYTGTKHTDVSSKFYTKEFKPEILNFVVLPVATLGIVLAIYFVNIPAMSANFTLIEAIRPPGSGDVSQNLNLFKKAFAYKSFGNSEAVEQLTQVTVQIANPQGQAPIEVKQQFFDFTKEKLEEKVASQPNDARYLVFAGSFFNRFGMYEEAKKYLDRARVESPKKQTIYFESGSTYLGLGQPEKMMELFKQAYEFKPEANESRIIYTVGAIYTKDTEVLKKLLPLIDENSLINDARILKAYSDMGDYNSVIFILKKRVEKNPSDLQAKLSLAAAYNNVGQKQNAINLIREIISLEPTWKDQGEQFIKQIQSQ